MIPVLALPAHRREEISHIFVHTKAAGYVVPDVWRGYDYRSLAAEMSRPGAVAAQCACARRARSGSNILEQPTCPKRRRHNANALADFRPAPDEVALMLLSGGTTGLPKLIPRTHNDYVYNCRQCGDVAGFNASDRVPRSAADGAQLHARLSRRARCASARRHRRDRTGYRHRKRRTLDRSRAGHGRLRCGSADRELAERRSPSGAIFPACVW